MPGTSTRIGKRRMRPYQALLCLPAALALVPLAGLALGLTQDPETPPAGQEKPPGLGALVDSERERLEQELDGVWLLLRYDPANTLFDSSRVQGVLMIREGFLSLNLTVLQSKREFLGPGMQLFVQGGTHRYRIDEFAHLQTAAIMSFHNFEDSREVRIEPDGTPREYAVELDESGNTLKLIKSDGSVLSWMRLTESEFPAESIEALSRIRANLPSED